jgi:hypothetical protein
VVEACTNIKFSTMTYWYEELLSQMKLASISPWTNKWNAVFDFTAHRTAPNGDPNWSISPDLNWNGMAPLAEVNEKITKVKAFKEHVKHIKDITPSDLECITLEFDEEFEIMSGLFDIGPYFNMYS